MGLSWLNKGKIKTWHTPTQFLLTNYLAPIKILLLLSLLLEGVVVSVVVKTQKHHSDYNKQIGKKNDKRSVLQSKHIPQ